MAIRAAFTRSTRVTPTLKISKVNNTSSIKNVVNNFSKVAIPKIFNTTFKTVVPRFSVKIAASPFSTISLKMAAPKINSVSLSASSSFIKAFQFKQSPINKNSLVRNYSEQAPQERRAPLTPEEKAEKQKKTVFVGGLSPSARPGEVRNFFSQYGEVASVRFLWVDRDIKTHRGNCFVEFATVAEAESAATAANGADVNGNTLRVNMAGAKPERKQNSNYQQADPAVSVFIGNLPFETVEDDLRQAFSNCGEIANISIPKNNITGKAKGFAILSFTSEGAKENALSCSGNELNGRPITVQNIVKKDPSESRFQRRDNGRSRREEEQQ